MVRIIGIQQVLDLIDSPLALLRAGGLFADLVVDSGLILEDEISKLETTSSVATAQ